MISFNCQQCGRAFNVPDEFAGRRAKCKSCGTPVVVPRASHAMAGVAAAGVGGLVATGDAASSSPRLPMRTRRLMADAKQMTEAFATSETIRVRPVAGDPPETYHVEYRVKGLAPGAGEGADPVPRDVHEVEIQLTADYPRLSPKCKMLTPAFHPNIDPATICVGDHWTAGERLADLVVRIGEMLAYQAYNIKSPLDGEAAMWADLNTEKLPTDSRNLRPAEMG